MINGKRALIILFSLVLLNCSSRGIDTTGGDDRSAAEHTAQAHRVVIGPPDATVLSVIKLQAETSLLSNADIAWYINGEKAAKAGGLRFTPDQLHKGDRIRAAVVKDGREFYSNELVIQNTPPKILRAALSPQSPKAGSVFTVELTTADTDNDVTGILYTWYVNNTPVSDLSFLEYDFKRGDQVAVEVVPADNEEKGKGVKLETTILNSLPVITEGSPVFDGTTYTYALPARDPDGDQLTFALENGPEGMTIDASAGTITWEVGPEDEGAHDIRIAVSDEAGGRIIVPLSVTIGFEQDQNE